MNSVLITASNAASMAGYGTHLLVQGLVVLEQRLERLQHLHLAGDPRRRLRLPLHHRHPQGTLVPRHQALQVLQEQLTDGGGQTDRQADRQTDTSRDTGHETQEGGAITGGVAESMKNCPAHAAHR